MNDGRLYVDKRPKYNIDFGGCSFIEFMIETKMHLAIEIPFLGRVNYFDELSLACTDVFVKDLISNWLSIFVKDNIKYMLPPCTYIQTTHVHVYMYACMYICNWR